MDKATIDKIEELAMQNRTVEVDGQVFSEHKLQPVYFTPCADRLTVHSLLGFCTYINNGFDGITKDDGMVIVSDINRTKLVSKLFGKDKSRETFIAAELCEVEEFPFGQFMTQEEFAIKFRSLFVPSEKNDTNYVLSFVSKLHGGTAIATEDDGITQQVGVSRGVSGKMTGKATLKPIVKLAPYRTFREIEQPESEFLLRMRLNSDNIPLVALFEADGGAWRITAMNRIAEYIAKACPDVKIIA
ncbi:hypothetical protein [Treponema sp. Marseille-Q4130]|uniref:hypothetical protein n=1 Tax=Treponema sp. Marseille-Q4130 TaxID=2766702 RepID=UPI0016525437|nr:hypothetical protein [Treponema sp. Marseille-Q4130]MBC6721312.1 hypothetical protein [Treponema sp. Marseille-Q4130]